MADDKKKIEDFGEKIDGARKDLYTKKGKLNLEDIANWTEYERQNLATKTNIWERPNYQKLVDNGLSKRCAFFIKAIYDSIPTKAPDSYSYVYDSKGNDNIDIYTDAVAQLRDICQHIRTDDDIRGFYSLLLTNFKHLDENRSGLFGSNTAGAFSTKLRRAISRYTSMYLLDLDIDAKKFLFSDDEKKLSKYDILKYNNNVSFDAAEDNRLAVSDIGTRYLYNQTEDFCRPENWESGKFFIMTNTYPYNIISNNFETEEAAKDFILEYEAELEKDPTTKSRKTKLTPPQLEHIERTGKDYRADRDIEGENFLTEFAMRGGQFGEWLNQNDRQANLNMCFDAFKDLAAALGVDDKDVSLGGQLAIAFGARGHSSALAHYEPAQNVINLTKMRGAGTLAHEWGHALDFFIARQYGLKNSFASESNALAARIINPETASEYSAYNAIKEVMLAIQYTPNHKYTEFYENAKKLDAAHSKAGHGYWASSVELFARAFACYIMDKLAPNTSDYLCGHAEMGGGAACTYPTGEERKNINSAIDKLIKQLKIEEIFHERPAEIENAIEEKAVKETKAIELPAEAEQPQQAQPTAETAERSTRFTVAAVEKIQSDALQKFTASGDNWADYCKSAAYTYKYSFNETLIMASQMPNATAMAEFGVWSKRLGARINRGSKGVPIVIQDNNGNKKLEYLYDISQTNSNHKLWQPDLSRVSESSIRELVNTALDTNNNIKQMPQEYKDFAIESAMLIACTRCGIDYTAANLDIVSGIDSRQFSALADTINAASKTVLRDIERHFRAVEQEQQKEAEIDKPQAEKSNQTKDGREIIGNTAYAKIKRKNFNTYVTPTARAIAAELEKDGIPYSGVIDGNSATITISFADKSKLDEIVTRVTDARKKDTPKKESNRISDELVEAAKRTNIVDYLNSKGIQTKRVGSEYTMIEHDSMRIKDSSYYWNSQNKGGNAVNFAMEVLGLEYRQALEDLLSFNGYTDFHSHETVTPVRTEKQAQPTEDEPHVVLPNELDNKTNRTYAYLTKTRGIPDDIVKSLIDNGSIAQDIRGNAVFKIFDGNGELTGAELTSTNTSHRFKQTTERGGNGFTINPTGTEKPSKVIFFEAGIDTMSYYALHKDTDALLVSMGGLKDKVVNTTLERYGITPENALIATDNDEAGKNFAHKMQETLGIPAHQLTDDPFFELCGYENCKDWNDLLISYNEKREDFNITENTKGISLDLLGNDGTWSVVGSFEENGRKLFELESDNYGFTDKVGHIVLTENGDFIRNISLAEKQAELSTAENVSHNENTFSEEEKQNNGIPQSIIVQAMKRGTGHTNGKFRVEKTYQTENTAKERIAFLKKEYGIGGSHSPNRRIGKLCGIESDNKGLTLEWNTENGRTRNNMTWNAVDKALKELIDNDNYITPEERKKYEREQFVTEQINSLNKGDIIQINGENYIFEGKDDYNIIVQPENFDFTDYDICFYNQHYDDYRISNYTLTNNDFTILPQQEQEIAVSNEHINLYKLGDFYEAYGEEAEKMADTLELHPIRQNGELMTGIPSFALERDIEKLNENGYIVDVHETPREQEIADLARLKKKFPDLFNAPTEDEPKKFPNTIPHRNFVNLQKLYPDIFNGEHHAEKYKGKDGMEDLSIEINDNILTLSHTYSQYGDLMYDPRIDYKIDFDNQTLQAVNYTMSGLNLYQEYPDNSVGQRDCNSFTVDWIKNLAAQQDGRYLDWAVAQFPYNNDIHDISVYFDESGKIAEINGDAQAVEAYKAEKGITLEQQPQEDVIQTIDLEKYSAVEVFSQLKAHLENIGMLPDEYFLMDARLDENMSIPTDATFVCYPNFGASEGIYLDIYMLSNGNLQDFATGKTLGEDYADFKRMGDIATECSLMLNSNGRAIDRKDTLLEQPQEAVIQTIELEKYSSPDENGRVTRVGMATIGDVFSQLEKQLKNSGILPADFLDYFQLSYGIDEKTEIPANSTFICQPNWGGNEGIRLDIDIISKGEIQPFASGKTLGEDYAVFKRMGDIATECNLLLNGNGITIDRKLDIHFEQPQQAQPTEDEPFNEWSYTANPVGDTMLYSVYRIKDKNEVDYSGNRDMAMSYIEDKALCIQIADALNNQGITDLEQAKAIAADMLNSSVQNTEKTDFEQALENVVGADRLDVIKTAFNENSIHGWQGDQVKENRIKKAFYDILADETLVEQAFAVFVQNTNTAEETPSYEAEKGSHNENDFSEDKELSAVFDSYTEFYNKLYEQGNNAVEGYDLAVSIGDDFIKKNPVFTGDFNELRGDVLSSDREIAAFAFALAENGVIEKFVEPAQEQNEDRTVFNLKGNNNEIADLTEHLELNGYNFDISKDRFYDVSYLSVLADDETYIKTILDDKNIDYTIQPKDLVIDIPEYGFKVDLKDSTIKLNTASYEKRDGIDVKKEDDVFFEFKAGEIRTAYYDRVNSMPIDISIDLDEAKEIVKKFLDEALNDRNKTVYIVNEISDEIAFIPPATETENIPQNNTPDRDSIKVGDMFYYRGGECEVYELSGQTENDITITYDNDTIDFPQPIYENINRDTLLQEGKYLGNALDKAESQIDAQKASTSVQAAPEAENVSHNENDFSEEINGYDNSTKYVIKSTDNADYPYNVQIMTSIDNGETYNYAGRGQFCTSLDETRAFINGDIADKLVVGDIIELGGEKLKITEIDSDFRMGFENTDKTAPMQVRSFIGHWKKNLLNELGDKPLVVEKDLSEQEKIIDSAEPIKEPAPEAEIKHINAADITLGDTFIYKNTEYTVTAMYGVYPDDIGISKKDGNFVITENVDKFKLAAEGNYLGNPDRVAENFKITDTELGVGTPREKFRANIEAIKTLKELERLNVPATKEQQEILSKYVGWGGLSEAFDTDPSKGWAKEYEELKGLLTNSEYESARSSVTDAFYTSPEIIKAMYSTLEEMGFEGGKILEPAMGIGNFFGSMPENIEKNSSLYGVEIDDISGRIAKQLYPDANIQIRGLEKTNFHSDTFDLAIGNVPFGQVRLSDKTFKKGDLIHDYFFKKALDKVRAGGVVAFITSSGTLDKKDSSVRKYLAERADLLGAVRLPNTAFKANAGTEVVSDILFLQKRSEPRDLSQDMPDWVNASEIDDSLYTDKARESGEIIRINDYFKAHPEAVAGEIKVVSNAYGFGITCDAKENETLAESINAALSTVRGKIEKVSHRETTFDRDISNEANSQIDPSKYPNFCMSVIDGEVYYRENDVMQKQDFKRSSDKPKAIELISIAETLKTLIEEQSHIGTSDSRIAELQAELNTKYDDYTKKYGLIAKSVNLLGLDDRKQLIGALEIINNDGELERKADIFTKRTVSVPAPVESVETPAEALVVSLGEKAKVDIAFMAQLCSQSEEYVISALQADGQIFKNPETEQYETRDEYLSGNVRKKLETAIESSVADESYKINVDALKTVQPIDLTSDEIMAQLGSTWIPTKYFEQFIYELLETPTYSRSDYEYKSNDDPFAARGRNWATIAVAYDPTTATYGISNKNVIGKDDVPSRSTYGTAYKSAYELIEACLNQTLVTVYDKDPVTEKRYVNKEKTAEAQAKQEMIKEMFADWIYADEDRANDLVQIYNEKFNSVVPREYNGNSLVLSGINPNIELRKHQKDAIARILYSNRNALIAHEVGAGKTFTLQAAGIEGKRLGLFHKSLYAVPKAILNQFAKEFLELYPSANILVATEKDFEKANRQSFFAKAVTGEYDAIVMSHEQFKKIPMSQEYQETYMRAEIDKITSELDRIKREDKGRGFSVKQLETKKKQLERKLKTLINSEDKDRALTFEELGVDKIFVDEAHAYKNLFFSTKMGRNVAGINAGVESQRATDMYMKCRYLDELTGSKGTVFSTGTPISNGIAEMYTMQKYLQNDVLRANGLENFDAWAANFGKIEAGMELTPESTGFQQKIRFSQFDNVPELTTMFKETADIKTADVLNIPNMPTPEFKVIDTPASPEQKELLQGLAERANDVRNRLVEPTEDNMLRITNDGRKLALDQRLLDPTLPDDPNSKVNLCIANVAKIWEESKDYKGTQIIFCDLSTPKNNGEFSVYRDIESKLSEQYGIPKEQILAIHDVSDKKKAEVMRKVNDGEIRILLGSTSKLGTGVNCQRLLKAVHHLDCPWKPADLQQRNGRIIRQGNLNKNVSIFNYVTSGTFDGYSYQLVENKQKSISQIMTSKTPERSIQDVDDSVLSYAEIKALAMDNPLLREQMMLDISLKKLETNYNSFCRGQNALKNKLNKDFPLTIEKAKHDIEKLSKDVETAEKHTPSDSKFAGIEIQGTVYTERAEAEKALLAACRTIKPYYGCGTKDVEIGCYKGFDLKAYYSSVSNHYVLKVQGADEYKVELGTVDGVRNIQRVDHLLGSTLKKELAKAEFMVESTQLKIQQAQKQLARTFPQLKELEEKRAKLKEINDKIAAQQEPPEPPKKGDDCL